MSDSGAEFPYRPSSLRRSPLRVLEAKAISRSFKWGRLSVTPHQLEPWFDRCSTISVYPPGTTTRTRRLLHLWHAISTPFGSMVAVTLGVLIGLVSGGGWLLVAAVLAIELLGYWALARTTRAARRETRNVTVRQRRPGRKPWIAGDVEQFHRVAEQLDRLDGHNLDPIAFEVEWGNIYFGITR